jgi:predicted MFS family arabinose efflux permease
MCGIVGVWMRRRLNETPLFLELEKRQDTAATFPLREALGGQRRALMLAVLITTVLTSAVVALFVLTPTLMQQHFGLSPRQTFGLSSIGIVFLNIGCVIAGLVVDQIGAWKAVALYSALMPVGTAALYSSLILGNGSGGEPGIANAFAGLMSGVVGAVPSVMITLFSTDILVSGISPSHSVPYAIWASAYLVALVVATRHTPWACAAFSLLAGFVGVATAAIYGRKRFFGIWRMNCDVSTDLRKGSATQRVPHS